MVTIVTTMVPSMVKKMVTMVTTMVTKMVTTMVTMVTTMVTTMLAMVTAHYIVAVLLFSTIYNSPRYLHKALCSLHNRFLKYKVFRDGRF
jgi:hypothetical protein